MRATAGLLLVTLNGCVQPAVRQVLIKGSYAQAISLLGDTLYSLPLNPEGGPARVARLSEARERLQKNPSSLPAWLALGGSTLEMGRLREAVQVYTDAAQQHPNDPRVWRWRGEALLRLRYLDRAIADFRKAGLLALNGPTLLLEAQPNPGDSVARAGGNPFSSVQYQIPFLLGFALYCKGDYSAASIALAEASKAALSRDESAQALLWLFFAVLRLGDGKSANQLLAAVRQDTAESVPPAALSLLLGFKGVIPSDSIRRLALSARGGDRQLFSYGIAYFLQLRPEQREDAELWLEHTRSGADWAALPYLAAEADLARLKNGGKVIVR